MIIENREILHLHGFCGSGGGAKGFNKGTARLNNLNARFRCLGGFDVDSAAIKDFERLAGVRGTVLDLFSRDQYRIFRGHEPPPDWREATPADIRRSANYEKPHIFFCSAPCKGFSGLLSESRSQSAKYQVLNQLAVRALWLVMEAYADDPIEFILFENVPRIQTRGRQLVDQIHDLVRLYGYASVETTHDCGRLGNLAQSRKRFLLVCRHTAKVRPFLYEPPQRPLRAVGEVLGRMPLPGDPVGGPMHAIPNLQWKTWVRLAFVKAGSDWRSLNELAVENGYLKDYLIIPDGRNGDLGVRRWTEPACTVIGNAKSNNGPHSVADPRQEAFDRGYGVTPWTKAARTIQSESAPSNGEFSVADPRYHGQRYCQFGVTDWKEHASTLTAQRSPGQGPFSVADPRPQGSEWHHNIYRIVKWSEYRGAITSGDGPSNGSQGVADPRAPAGAHRKYHVNKWDGHSWTVIGGDDQGAYAVADPRMATENYKVTKYKVTPWGEASRTVIGGSTTGDGAFAVADPRILNREKGDHYLTGGQYGVVPWDSPSGVISGSAGHDSGRFSVADPRLPAATEKLICVIRALDETWHRPFTTLELAALQSLVDPEELFFDLHGNSDSAKRERIGNAVPPDAAQAIASVMGQTLLGAWSGETFKLSDQPVWVRPITVALSVKTPEVSK